MPEVLLSNDDITVLGPPNFVDVQIDVGPTGTRGSKVFAGAGNPNPLTTNGVIFGEEIYLNDLYINNSTGSEYSYMYQYVSRPSGPTWIEVLKVNPSIYSEIAGVVFDNGVGSHDIPISNIVQNTGTTLSANNFAVQFSPQKQGVDMISQIITSVEITGVSDEDLTINFKAIEYDGTSWSDVTGNTLVTTHLFVSVVI